MSLLNRLIKPTCLSGGLAFMLAACGGAPNSNSNITDSTQSGSDQDLVTVELTPTTVSLSVGYNDAPGTGVFDGVDVEVNAYLSNLVSNHSYTGQVVEFVAEGGTMEGSCIVETGSGCTVTWTSAHNANPNGIAQTTIGLLVMVPGGAEPFTDANGNELYDEGETFEDITEPYRDDNDSGSWELGEYYFDQNGNGTWDSGNGVWDGPCSFTTTTCSSSDGIVIFDTWPFPLTDADGNFL